MTTTAVTHIQSRLGALSLLWLLTRSDRTSTRSELNDRLTAFLGHRGKAEEQRQVVDEEIAVLERAGHIAPTRKRSYALTNSGRRASLAWLGVEALPAKTNWTDIKTRYLPARALGMPVLEAEAATSRNNHAKPVHAMILARHDRLPVGSHPTLTQVKNALAWRAFGIESSKPFNRNAVLKHFLSRSFGVAKVEDPDKVLEQRATKAVGARKTDATTLKMAMLRRWLDDLEVVPLAEARKDTPAGTTAALTAKPRDDDRTFAAKVLEAARTSKTGRFGDSKVFISHVFRKLVSEGAFEGDSTAFKNRLLSAHFRGFLSLSRADLVEAMKPEDVGASETEHDGSTFHFVLTRE